MHQTSSPIDLPATPLDRPGLRWTSTVIAVTATLLLVANAVSIRDWIDDLPPGPLQAQASTFANSWVDFTAAAAIGRPRLWLHDLWKAAEAARF